MKRRSRGRRGRAHARLSIPLLVLPLLASCGRGEPRVPPELTILRYRIQGIRELLSAARRGPIVSFQQMLIVVDPTLVQRLLSAAAPYERVVGDAYRVRVDSAAVAFEDGFATVRLDGRASLVGGAGDVFADISLYGGLDVLGVDPSSGTLRARIPIFGVVAHRVGVLGMEPPVRHLVEDLSREEIREFDVFSSELEIPVRLQSRVKLPRVNAGDEDDRVGIPAAEIPLRVVVQDVKAVRGKLWVSVGMAFVPPGAERSPPAAIRTARQAAPGATGGRDASPGARDTSPETLQGLRALHAALRDSLDRIVAGDSLLTSSASDTAAITVAVRQTLFERLADEVVRRYLDQVELDLTPSPVDEEGDLKVGTPVGKVKAGEWHVRLQFQALRGVLRATAPEMSVAGGSRIHVAVPVDVVRGEGAGRLHFAWDPKGLVDLVCNDFETALDITGSVLPGHYVVEGDFVLTPRGKTLVARPEFEREKYPIRVDLSQASWSKVRAILDSQNRGGRCGVMHPDDVMEDLRGLGRKGFKIKLPRSLFEPFEIPAGLTESVAVGGRRIRLSVLPLSLRLVPGTFWYSATVRAQAAAPATP